MLGAASWRPLLPGHQDRSHSLFVDHATLARCLGLQARHHVALVAGDAELCAQWHCPEVLTVVVRAVEDRGVGGVAAAPVGGIASDGVRAVSYTHLRAHETDSYLVCRLLLEKKKQ